MNGRSVLGLLGVLATVAAACVVGTASAGASQMSPAAPCPAAFELRTVESFVTEGPYIVPSLVDEAGNRNGMVCALELPAGARDGACRAGSVIACELGELGLPVYQFKDDSPAAG